MSSAIDIHGGAVTVNERDYWQFFAYCDYDDARVAALNGVCWRDLADAYATLGRVYDFPLGE